jgi:hypothetical protein
LKFRRDYSSEDTKTKRDDCIKSHSIDFISLRRTDGSVHPIVALSLSVVILSAHFISNLFARLTQSKAVLMYLGARSAISLNENASTSQCTFLSGIPAKTIVSCLRSGKTIHSCGIFKVQINIETTASLYIGKSVIIIRRLWVSHWLLRDHGVDLDTLSYLPVPHSISALDRISPDV